MGSRSGIDKPEFSFKRVLLLGIPAALIACALRMFVFGLFVVPTSSMAPTLLMGDYIVADKLAYGFSGVSAFGGLVSRAGRIGGHAPQRGDIVVFVAPYDGSTLVKRLVGLPGDAIQMYRGELYLNRQLVKRERLPQPLSFPGDDEPSGDIVDYAEYLPPDNKPHAIRLIRQLEDEETVNNTPEFIVPPHCYFFMGDNRDNSDDSRVTDLGFVPEENIIGRAKLVFFSMSNGVRFMEFGKWSWAVRWHRLGQKVI